MILGEWSKKRENLEERETGQQKSRGREREEKGRDEVNKVSEREREKIM